MLQPLDPLTQPSAFTACRQHSQGFEEFCPYRSAASSSPAPHAPTPQPCRDKPSHQNNVWRSLWNKLQALPLAADFHVIFDRDPAARNWLEVLCCYPGLHAIACHRVAHWLYRRHVPILPRLISHLARFVTGIEIHPGASLGQGVFIDHGMGVVIGETAIVGNYTLIYQGVTLGGTGKETGKRHPTVGHSVVIGAGAKILGNIHIGDNARIGAGSIVLRHVPSNCTAVGVPGRNICRSETSTCLLDHNQLPDAEATVTRQLLDRIEELESQVKFLMSL